ncbi:hypothetical protein Ssi03_70790 [Sphaerisporangium siamense]|nr:hypothetical protein Ssi03_70790 [Sphaerisporangium siamense]
MTTRTGWRPRIGVHRGDRVDIRYQTSRSTATIEDGDPAPPSGPTMYRAGMTKRTTKKNVMIVTGSTRFLTRRPRRSGRRTGG